MADDDEVRTLSVVSEELPAVVEVTAGGDGPFFFVPEEQAEEAWIRLTAVGMVNMAVPIVGTLLSELDSVFTPEEKAAIRGAYGALLSLRLRLDPEPVG
jgi:hypothetical protein